MSESILSPTEPNVNGGIRLAGWAFRQGEITPTEILVLTALAAFSDKKGECWPKVSTIASMAHLEVRAVQLNLAKLREKKIIEVLKDKHKRGPNFYRILRERHAKAKKLKAIKKILLLDADLKRSDILVLLYFLDLSITIGKNYYPVRQCKITSGTWLSCETVEYSIDRLLSSRLIYIEFEKKGLSYIYVAIGKFKEIVDDALS